MMVNHPNVIWHLPAELRRSFLNANGVVRLNEWLSLGLAQLIKIAPHRSVWRVRVAEHDLYLKEYRAEGLRGRVRELIRPIKAKAEFDRAGELIARGVPAPRPVGWGVLGPMAAPRASFLITAAIPAARPLSDVLERGLIDADRRQISRALGEFLAKLHAAGVMHYDLHPGNILITAGNPPGLFLIDWHAIRLGPPLSWNDRSANLSVFNRYFILRSNRSDRLRFWRAYCHSAGPVLPDDAATASPAQLEEATWRSNAGFWEARERRYCSENRHFARLQRGPYSGWAVRDFDIRAIEPLLTDPDRWFDDPATESLKSGGASSVAALWLETEQGPIPVVLKRFNVRSWLDPWKNLARRTPAVRSWVMGHGLLDAGLPTAKPLAVVQCARNGLPGEGYLLTERIEGVLDLREFARMLAAMPVDQRRGLLRERLIVIARTVRELHRRRLGHRDLKAANLLTPIDPDDHRAWFIDLVGVHRRGGNTLKTRLHDLARLAASFLGHPAITNTDKLRFLRIYLDWATRGKGTWKQWWRELGEAAQAKVARNVRRGRPVG